MVVMGGVAVDCASECAVLLSVCVLVTARVQRGSEGVLKRKCVRVHYQCGFQKKRASVGPS